MTHSDWGASLLAEVQLLKGSDTEAKYAKAHEKILCAKTIIDKTSYNLACLLALTGERDQALEKLVACQEGGTLKDAAHSNSDTDLDGFRGMDGFKEFVKT